MFVQVIFDTSLLLLTNQTVGFIFAYSANSRNFCHMVRIAFQSATSVPEKYRICSTFSRSGRIGDAMLIRRIDFQARIKRIQSILPMEDEYVTTTRFKLVV